jgi:hypothetical protein
MPLLPASGQTAGRALPPQPAFGPAAGPRGSAVGSSGAPPCQPLGSTMTVTSGVIPA